METGFDTTTVDVAPPPRAVLETLAASILKFTQEWCEAVLFDYQYEFAFALVVSVLAGDGADLTALFSRQSGKTETVADVATGLMVILPRLAKAKNEDGESLFPWLAKFRKGFWVGVFAPTDEQADTMWQRIKGNFTSEQARQLLGDPEIDDKVGKGGAKTITLVKSRSLMRAQTAHPKASIESKTYHLICSDESQRLDDFVWNKSIKPMGAWYNATKVMTGTTDIFRNVFFKQIKKNQRDEAERGGGKSHFQFDWKYCAKNNKNYAAYVANERGVLGADSDEFQMSYCLKWPLERGMFTTDEQLDALSDKGMKLVPSWHRSALVAGLDLGRRIDSTVLTIVWVDWERPDAFGNFDHRILNWLEIQGDRWETQYAKVVDFLDNYSVTTLAIDGQGLGDVAGEDIARLLPRIDVRLLGSTTSEQSTRWKHLLNLVNRGGISWPGHAHARRTKQWQRFTQQMRDLEKIYQGKFLMAAAPKEAGAHDDYPDSLALACALTKELTMPTVQVSGNPFYRHSRRTA